MGVQGDTFPCWGSGGEAPGSSSVFELLTMLTAAVLAGGASSRMGRDKAALLLGGVSLLRRAADRAAACADEVLVVGREGFPGLSGVRLVPDLGGPPSSMRGLHAALTHAAEDRVLLLACDMPFWDPGLVDYMKGLCRDADVVVPRPGGRYEPLCAIYRTALAARAEALLAEGRLKLRFLLEERGVRVRTVEDGDYPFGENAFFNINAPEDYRRALAIFAAEHSRRRDGGGHEGFFQGEEG